MHPQLVITLSYLPKINLCWNSHLVKSNTAVCAQKQYDMKPKDGIVSVDISSEIQSTYVDSQLKRK